MHRAPAVSFSVVRSRWHVRAILLMCLLGAAAIGTFVQDQPQAAVQATALIATWLLVTTTALIAWYRSPLGTLRWDGQLWHWSGLGEAQACTLSVLADGQSVLLVSLKAQAQPRAWLWLETVSGDLQWMALRRAIVSGQRQQPHEADLDASLHSGESA